MFLSPFTLSNIHISKASPVTGLKNIALNKKQETLQSATVIGQKGLIENKIDRLVFNAERDMSSQTGVATDLLMKVPQVSVDVDGNVELEGSTNVLFLINGKPSTIFGSNITDVLQSIPANQIKSIEVITNPGAKYDAQGTGGIINIILKHNTIQGVNGNVSLTAGTLIQNGSLNINARKGKFGLNAFVNGSVRLTTTRLLRAFIACRRIPQLKQMTCYNKMGAVILTDTGFSPESALTGLPPRAAVFPVR